MRWEDYRQSDNVEDRRGEDRYGGGGWAYHASANHRILQEGDVEAAMRVAAAVGDDRLQQARRGAVVPESFTHGSSTRRTTWFMAGLKSGALDRCNTFAPGAVSAN